MKSPLRAQLDRGWAIGAAAGLVAGLAAASLLVPSGVDAVATDVAAARPIVAAVAQHPLAVRMGFLCWVAAALCIPSATRPWREAAVERGSWAAEIGWRMICVGACGAAIGNAFAPAILPSVLVLPAEEAAMFVHAHETSGASFAILAVYALLPIGAVPFAIGVGRSGVVPVWRAAALGLALFGVMPTPLGPFSLALAACFAVALFWPGRLG
jgi:hypothetical protein